MNAWFSCWWTILLIVISDTIVASWICQLTVVLVSHHETAQTCTRLCKRPDKNVTEWNEDRTQCFIVAWLQMPLHCTSDAFALYFRCLCIVLQMPLHCTSSCSCQCSQLFLFEAVWVFSFVAKKSTYLYCKAAIQSDWNSLIQFSLCSWNILRQLFTQLKHWYRSVYTAETLWYRSVYTAETLWYRSVSASETLWYSSVYAAETDTVQFTQLKQTLWYSSVYAAETLWYSSVYKGELHFSFAVFVKQFSQCWTALQCIQSGWIILS